MKAMVKVSSVIPVLVLTSVSILLSGCATKHYGRQPELTSFEESTLSCREMDLEIAKVEGFLQTVDDESSFDGRSVLSFLGDFGIGNVLEKNSAVDSANKRLDQLKDLRFKKQCNQNNGYTGNS